MVRVVIWTLSGNTNRTFATDKQAFTLLEVTEATTSYICLPEASVEKSERVNECRGLSSFCPFRASVLFLKYLKITDPTFVTILFSKSFKFCTKEPSHFKSQTSTSTSVTAGFAIFSSISWRTTKQRSWLEKRTQTIFCPAGKS